ncbi:Armadillo repeat-containing protein 2 [Homalodisca vitripennis]|nr:Armadillo repeat-containing protein 2 [Homalodisca vitripennis]
MATVANKVNMMETRSQYNPFYTPPSCIIKTSAEIVSEARAAMEHKAVRAVNTKRPFTPRDSHRILFGRNNSGRPPSAISLGQVKFHDFESTLPKLSTGNVSFLYAGEKLPKLQRTRLPAITDVRRKKHYKSTTSLDNLPEEVEADVQPDVAVIRQTHSSPKERTSVDILTCSPTRRPQELWTSVRQPISEESGEELTPRRSEQEVIIPREKFPPVVEVQKKTDRGLRDFKSLAFSEPRGSPKGIIGMDKLMEATDNKINEARVNARKQVVEIPAQVEKIKPPLAEPSDTLDSILAELQKLRKREAEDGDVISVFERLYNILEKENIPASKNTKLKSHILKSIYKFVENAGETLLLHITRIALMLRVSGHNLSAVCKLIFKISRTDKNDRLFQDTNVLELFMEALGRASPLEDAEACIYGYGALKFLTMNNQLLRTSLQHGALELMVLHIKIVNNARLDLLSIPEQTSHAMFQLTGALRNVASEETTFPQFVASSGITELCRAMELFSADLDLICNISRTLSILSTNESCCGAIVAYDTSFRTITKVLRKFPGRQDIVVRLGYALGNIMAKCHPARLKLYEEPGGLSAILGLLENYLDKDLEMMSASDDSDLLLSTPELGSDGSVEDVIIKMIRIVANMCLHPTVGAGLTCAPSNDDNDDNMYPLEYHSSKDGGRFIDILLTVLRRKSVAESEELILSTLSTLNNLSFYTDPETARDSPFGQRQLEVAQGLSALLLTGNDDCLVEVTRVFGNLTRSKETRDYILETGGISHLVRCLSHENRELLCTVTGVLVNLMADWDKRLAFKEDNGINRLLEVLERQGEQDWQLASLVCQALWNFCIDSTHLYAALGIQPTNHLLAVLIDLLDEERLFGVAEDGEIEDSVANNPEYQQWEQFAGVATNLLEKIEQYLESLQAFKEEI